MRDIVSPLAGFSSPFGRGADPYAILGYKPPLVLDYENSKFRVSGSTSTAPSVYTATRTGLATQLDASGNLVWNAHNLALNSATPATQNITVVSGADYTVECTGSGSITLSGAGTGSVTEGNPVEITASTTTLTLTVVGSLDTMWAYRSDLGGMAPVPLTRRVAGSTTYVPTTSAAVYLPREEAYTYVSGSLVGPYYQKESDARTNLVTYSEDFTNGSFWASGNASITPDYATSPDGTTNAYRLQDNGNTGNAPVTVYFDPTVSTSTTYTYSVFLKADQLSWALLNIENFTTPASGGCYFDLSTGSVGTAGAGIFGNIEDFGNGWYRCSVTFTTDATDTTGRIRIYLADADGDAAVARDGTSSILIYGAQFEQGSTPTSYIPTSGSTVTRSADSTTISAGNMPYPTPQVIGPELVKNGTFDTDSDWTKGTGITITGGEAVFTAVATGQNLRQPITLPAGVYLISYDVTEHTTGGVAVFGPAYSPDIQRTAAGSYSEVAYFPGNGNFDIRARGTTILKVDNISVREINPLALSFQMEGLMTGESSTFANWTLDANNGIQITSGASDFTFTQEAAGVVDSVTGGSYTSGINVPFNIASRHGSTFINGAVDGTALTADTTPTALPDLSATTFDLAPTFNGFIKEFRVWADDIGDTGIAEAST